MYAARFFPIRRLEPYWAAPRRLLAEPGRGGEPFGPGLLGAVMRSGGWEDTASVVKPRNIRCLNSSGMQAPLSLVPEGNHRKGAGSRGPVAIHPPLCPCLRPRGRRFGKATTLCRTASWRQPSSQNLSKIPFLSCTSIISLSRRSAIEAGRGPEDGAFAEHSDTGKLSARAASGSPACRSRCGSRDCAESPCRAGRRSLTPPPGNR